MLREIILYECIGVNEQKRILFRVHNATLQAGQLVCLNRIMAGSKVGWGETKIMLSYVFVSLKIVSVCFYLKSH